MAANKIAFIIIVLLLAGSAHASLDLSINDMKNGKIMKDGVVYNVLSDENVFLMYHDGYSEYRRIVVENENKISELREKAGNLTEQSDKLSAEVSGLYNETLVLQASIDQTEKITAEVEKSRDAYKSEITRLREQKKSFENSFASMVILSPLAFRVGLAVFVVLFIIVLGMKLNFLVSSQKPVKSLSVHESASTRNPYSQLGDDNIKN